MPIFQKENLTFSDNFFQNVAGDRTLGTDEESQSHHTCKNF